MLRDNPHGHNWLHVPKYTGRIDNETLIEVEEEFMRSPHGFPALATAARQREMDQRVVPPCKVLMKDGVALVKKLPKLAPPPEEETPAQKAARVVLDGLGWRLT